MFDLLSSPRFLHLLTLAERARAAYRRRRGDSRAAERNRDRFYAQCWREAAEGIGATIVPLGDEIYEIRRVHCHSEESVLGGTCQAQLDRVSAAREFDCTVKLRLTRATRESIRDNTQGEFRTRVCRNYTAIDDPVTLLLAGSKPATYRQLAACGLPIAEHLEFTLTTATEAAEFLKRAAAPCVVKPARDTGAGRGVTTGITGRGELQRAIISAASHCPELLIEKQIAGEVYRLLYLDGVLLDAVVRHAPAVTGDGRSTISQLLAEENAERLARGAAAAQVLIMPDFDMVRTLAQQGWRLASVPPAGTKVVLKTVVNDNQACENESALHDLCPEVVEAGARAARAVGAKLAGVDVLTPDPGLPLEAAGGVILEVNTTPGFFYHYQKQGEPCRVALHVLEHLRNSVTSLVSLGT